MPGQGGRESKAMGRNRNEERPETAPLCRDDHRGHRFGGGARRYRGRCAVRSPRWCSWARCWSAVAKRQEETVGVGKLTYLSAQQSYHGNNPVDGYKLTATCPSGTHVLGGGTKLVSPNYDNSNFFMISDYP